MSEAVMLSCQSVYGLSLHIWHLAPDNSLWRMADELISLALQQAEVERLQAGMPCLQVPYWHARYFMASCSRLLVVESGP